MSPHSRPQPLDLHGLVDQVVAGRFRVLSVRHAGPRSLVYEAEPPGVGQSRRALKVIGRPEAREPEALDRLRQFVEATRGLQHPGLERVHEIGTLPDETPWILTEWLPLTTLDDTLAHAGRLPTARGLEVVGEVAEALDALHGRGLCHGDVRPAHVLVSPTRNGFDRVVLTDAGVAAQLQSPLPRGVEGALAYLAPERLAGGDATPASDVYALGVLAWHLLAGRLPFRPDDSRARGAGPDPAERVRWLHLYAPPQRPSRHLREPDFPPAVDIVVERALAKDPARRYPDARAFIEALERALLARSPDPEPEIEEAPPAADDDDTLPEPAPAVAATAATPPPGRLRRWWLAGAAAGVLLGALAHLVG